MKGHAVFMDILKSPVLADDGEALPATEESSFGDILSEFEQHGHSGGGSGQAIDGTVVSISAESVFVDIGRKMEGTLPVEPFKEPSGGLSIRVGDHVLVTISGRRSEEHTSELQ